MSTLAIANHAGRKAAAFAGREPAGTGPKKAPNAIDRHVGQRVRMRRLLLGLTQENLGAALGLTFQQVHKYEKGTNRIGASRLQQIATFLQASPTYFFEGAPDVAAPRPPAAITPDPVQALASTQDGLRLIQAFCHIATRAEREIVVRMAETLAERGK